VRPGRVRGRSTGPNNLRKEARWVPSFMTWLGIVDRQPQMPGYHQGRPPRNKGLRYLADPPTVEEIVAVMRSAGNRADGARLRALIVILWRAGLRISEALALAETDLDQARGAVLVRRGKGGRRREVGTDRWAWQQLQPWLEIRAALPVGRCCASSTGRPLVETGSSPLRASSCDGSPLRLACGGASRRTSSATRMRSRWRMRASRSSSYSGSSATPTSARSENVHLGRRARLGRLRDGPRRSRFPPGMRWAHFVGSRLSSTENSGVTRRECGYTR
jgi:integrase